MNLFNSQRTQTLLTPPSDNCELPEHFHLIVVGKPHNTAKACDETNFDHFPMRGLTLPVEWMGHGIGNGGMNAKRGGTGNDMENKIF